MEAIHDISNLLTKRCCRIVFVKDRETAAQLADRFTATYPEYLCTIGEQFANFKQFGPFKMKNKKSLWDILYQTQTVQAVKEALSQTEAFTMLEDEMKAMDLWPLYLRRPRALSRFQKYRSSILRDLFEGKLHFLLNDSAFDDPEDSAETRIYRKKGHLDIAKYLQRYMYLERAYREVIWITDLTPYEMLDLLGKDEYRSGFYGFYTLRDGCVTAMDKTTLIRGYETQKGLDLPPFVGDTKYDIFTADSVVDTIMEPLLATPLTRGLLTIEEFRDLAVKRYSEAEISVFMLSGTGKSRHVTATMEKGQLSAKVLLRSLRTGKRYLIFPMPVDTTYTAFRRFLKEGEQEGRITEAEETIRDWGYDPDWVRNYEYSAETVKVTEAMTRKVSYGDSGLLTWVTFPVIPIDEKPGANIDIREEDILVGVEISEKELSGYINNEVTAWRNCG